MVECSVVRGNGFTLGGGLTLVSGTTLGGGRGGFPWTGKTGTNRGVYGTRSGV